MKTDPIIDDCSPKLAAHLTEAAGVVPESFSERWDSSVGLVRRVLNSDLVEIFEDDERNALMTALRNASENDGGLAPCNDDDLISLYMERTPKTSFVCELVNELRGLGFRIERAKP